MAIVQTHPWSKTNDHAPRLTTRESRAHRKASNSRRSELLAPPSLDIPRSDSFLTMPHLDQKTKYSSNAPPNPSPNQFSNHHRELYQSENTASSATLSSISTPGTAAPNTHPANHQVAITASTKRTGIFACSVSSSVSTYHARSFFL